MSPEVRAIEDLSMEELVLPHEFEFMSIDNMNELRAQQLGETVKVQHEVIFSDWSKDDMYEEMQSAKNGLKEKVDEDSENYVAQHISREDDPDLFDQLKELVASASYYRTGSDEWYLGEPDEDGNHTRLETSLKSQYEDALRGIFGSITRELPVDKPPLPREEDINTAQEVLEGSRQCLAVLSIKRGRLARKGSKVSKQLEKEYTEAQQIYENARIALGSLNVQTWEHYNVDPQEIKVNVVKYILNEHQHFTKAEAKILAQDQSRMSRVARLLARHNWKFMVGSGAVSFAAGIGINKLSKGAVAGALGLAGAAVLPASVAAGVAIKTTKAVLQTKLGNQVHQHLSHDKNAQKDHASLKDSLDVYLGKDNGHDLVRSGNSSMTETIDTRVDKNISSNRNRIIGAFAISSAAGAAGFLAAGAAAGSWPFEHHAHSVVSHHSISGNHDSAIQKPPLQRPNSATSPIHHTPHHKPGVIDGYQSHVDIKGGEGYDQALTDLAAQKHIHLSGAQSWQLYEHLNSVFHGNFLTNDPSYHMNNAGEWGISRAGAAHWNPAVIHEMNHWLSENGLNKAAKALKTSKKLVAATTR